jgi:molybdopterin-binding protein
MTFNDDEPEEAHTRSSLFVCSFLIASALVQAQTLAEAKSASDLANPIPVAPKTTPGVMLSVGNQQITSIITARSAREMGLKPGQAAAALIKATEVMILRV